MLKSLIGCSLGVWVAHKEGRFTSIGDATIAMQYISETSFQTTDYPLYPNRSIKGIAGVCSPDGRHLIMMPHPERTFLNWQVPYMPEKWRKNKYYPWIMMFKAAYNWVTEQMK